MYKKTAPLFMLIFQTNCVYTKNNFVLDDLFKSDGHVKWEIASAFHELKGVKNVSNTHEFYI